MQQHSASEALELDEADVFDHDHGEEDCPGSPQASQEAPDDRQHSPHQESEDEELFDLHMHSSVMEIGAEQHNGSAKSSTLNVVLEEADGVLLEEDGSPHGQPPVAWGQSSMAASVRQRSCKMGSQQMWMAQSLPVSSAGIMGSSVPINIPFMAQKLGPKDAANPVQQAPQTFVPPHQLSQRDDYTLAMMGESPGGAMRRDRLRMRNSILKSTGFLENASLLPGMVAGVGIVGGGEVHMPAITPVRGGLAQALQLSSSPAVR